MTDYMKKLLPVLLMASAGCSTVRYIPVERSHADSMAVVHARIDSIAIKDSTTLDRRTDTVRITRWRTETRWHTGHDTVWRTRTDTIRITAPPLRITAKESVWDTMGNVALGICCGLASALFIFRRIRR